jgi:hypothetical protein
MQNSNNKTFVFFNCQFSSLVYDNSKLILKQYIISVTGNSVLVGRQYPGNIHGVGINRQEQIRVSNIIFMTDEIETETGKLNEANTIF